MFMVPPAFSLNGHLFDPVFFKYVTEEPSPHSTPPGQA